MDNLAFHITDITANSIRAKSSRIEIETSETEHKRSIKIIDNGTGMSKEVVDQVTNPFYTTRTTRKMGFGLPFLKQNAEQAGGRVEIQSEPGKGTTVYAEFDTQNIDCPPGQFTGNDRLVDHRQPKSQYHLFMGITANGIHDQHRGCIRARW